MLTIHSGINRNVNMNPAFGKNRSFKEQELKLEMDALTQEYNEERETWVEQKRSFEEMIHDKEAQLPKPVKTVMKGGAVLAAGVLGGMATGYSAKYIMNSYEYGKLYDFIRSSVKEILGNFFNFTCYTHEAIWILKNEFDVDFKRIYVALKREFEYMDCSAGADYFKSGTFDLNKRLADCALSAEGYEILSSRLMSALL